VGDNTQLVGGLAAIVGRDQVWADQEKRSAFAVDQLIPKAVVFPLDAKQVAGVVAFANRENLAIIPRGSGTKMGMGNPPRRLDLILSTSRMNRMIDMDTANLTLTAEAGVKFKDIQGELASQENRCYLPLEDPVTTSENRICSFRENKGAFLPIDPPFAEKATLGGILAANSNGPRRLLYGLPRDLLLGVRFVSANGDILGTGGKTVKNVSGFDISKLMIGSSGTLGILCEATLRLLPLPEAMETLLVPFGSFSGAAVFADQISETSLLPAAVEVMNAAAVGCLDSAALFGLRPGGYLVALALEGCREAVARMRKEMLERAEKAGASKEKHLEEEGHRAFWHGVSHLVPSSLKRSPGLLFAQLNYPLSRWKEILEGTERVCAAEGLDPILLCHTGSGVCLAGIPVDQGDSGASEKGIRILDLLLEQCLPLGGNLVIQRIPSGQKEKVSVWGRPGSDLIVMKWIKERLDPTGLMSPGRFVGGL
jgi:glycolate oxidase FAD binding subunit